MNTTAMFSALILASVVTAASAFEPYDPKKEPEEVRAFDHLRPIDRAAREFRYLAQYWVESVDEPPRYVVVVCDEATRRYYVEQGTPPKRAQILGKPYRFKKRAEISSETANIIYEFWVNVLLQTHYDRKGLSAIDLGADICTFSTFVSHLGWLHGFKGESVGDDLPPDWIRDAGNGLFDFVTKPRGDEKELERRILADRDKFYEYMKSLDRQQKTPSPTATPGKN